MVNERHPEKKNRIHRNHVSIDIFVIIAVVCIQIIE